MYHFTKSRVLLHHCFYLCALLLLNAYSLPAHDDDDFEIEGHIQNIGEDSLVVNDFIFYVDSETRVKGDDHHLQFSDLAVGNYVEVEGRPLDNGRYYAEKIELEDMDDDDDSGDDDCDDELETRGAIQQIDSNLVVVNDYHFIVTAETRIKADNDRIGFDDLTVGMFVKVEGFFRNDSLFAKKIELNDKDDHDDHEMEFYGHIDSVLAGSIIINNRQILVNSETKIELNDDQNATLADLTPGLFVEVKVTVQDDGALLALRIKVEDADKDKISISGYIDSVGVDFILVMDYRVEIDESTEIKSHGRDSLTIADLEKGQRVKIKGMLTGNNQVLADKIKVKRFYQHDIEFSGPVTFIGLTEIRVGQTSFLIDSATLIYNNDHDLIPFDLLMVGQFVEVKARLTDDGSFYAVKIKLEDKGRSEVEITGLIEAIKTDAITVSGVTFFVDSNTTVIDLQGNTMLFSDLSVDDQVEIKGILQNDGSLRAVRIKLEDTPGLMVVRGDISGVSSNQIGIEGPQYQLTGTTILLDENYSITSLENFRSGKNITVWAMPSESGNTILQAKLNKNTTVSNLEDEIAGLPQKLLLHANYPNPFNPETNISFTINEDGLRNVQIDIYDITGKRVRTLFNGQLDRGSYTFKWNGTNDQDLSVSSGIFIYRMKSDGIVQSRKMMLIR